MKKLFLISAVMLLAFASCKKDCPAPVENYNMSGTTWTGTYIIPGLAITNQPMNLSFSSAGTLSGNLMNGGTFNIAGTWNLVPGSTTVNLFFTVVTVSGSYVSQATLTTNNTKLESGVMTNATSPTANGTFSLTRN
ncbi:MAG: hypothetical protein WBP16_06645 [Ferruginibacter sp.]